MLCGFYYIINSVVNNSVKAEKDFKHDSFGLNMNLRLVLLWPALSVNICHLNKVTRTQGNVLFLVVSMGCGEQQECKNMSRVTYCKSACLSTWGYLHGFLTLLHLCPSGIGKEVWAQAQDLNTSSAFHYLWNLLKSSRLFVAQFSELYNEVIIIPILMVYPEESLPYCI